MSDSFGQDVRKLHESAHGWVAPQGDHDVLEIFSERSFREHITLSYGRRGTHGGPSELYDHEELAGTGVRSIGSSVSRFAFSDSLNPEAVEKDVGNVIRASSPSARDRTLNVDSAGQDDPTGQPQGSLNLPEDVVDAVTLNEKRHLLQAAADAALSLEPSLQDLDVSFQGSVRRFSVWASDIQPILAATANVGIRVFAAAGRASAHAVGGARGGIGHFLNEPPETIAEKCISRLRTLQEARSSKAIRGEMPVVLEGGWGGVWLHETVGHLLEADTQSPHSSDTMGTRIGSDQVTVIDDGLLSDGRGTCPFDDEGMPCRRTVLVDRGILQGLLTDRRTARSLNLPRTANGRRQDYRSEPLPRMSNLILANGTTSAADLVEDVALGLYVRMIGSGEVRPADDRFQFDVLEGYVIEEGRLTAPVTSLRIGGKPSTMLRRVVGVGDDFKIDPARGTCMKAGQTVPVSVGMPTVLLDRLSVTPAS